eukprot:s4698_g4.t1
MRSLPPPETPAGLQVSRGDNSPRGSPPSDDAGHGEHGDDFVRSAAARVVEGERRARGRGRRGGRGRGGGRRAPSRAPPDAEDADPLLAAAQFAPESHKRSHTAKRAGAARCALPCELGSGPSSPLRMTAPPHSSAWGSCPPPHEPPSPNLLRRLLPTRSKSSATLRTGPRLLKLLPILTFSRSGQGNRVPLASVPAPVVSAIRAGRIIALRKPNKRVRALVVGDVLRRLVGCRFWLLGQLVCRDGTCTWIRGVFFFGVLSLGDPYHSVRGDDPGVFTAGYTELA